MSAEMKLEDAMQVVGSYADGNLMAGRIDNVGVVLFNQPAKRNAVSIEMWDGVCETLDLFAADNGVRVVVYAGAGGKAFVSGSDISQFAARRNSAEPNAEFARLTGRGRSKLATFPKPSIACLEGYCVGGGIAIALQADLRVAASHAVFAIPAARLGIAYGIEPMERLVALVGPARARLMLYTGRRFTAEEAFTMGLVEMVAPEHDVVREAVDLARSIAENAPLSVLAAKFTIEQVLKDAVERDVAGVAEYMRRCMDSADYHEGRTAFTEKRKPVFVGA
jgi:enoyl-CoA hydratase/carnithine racemase